MKNLDFFRRDNVKLNDLIRTDDFSARTEISGICRDASQVKPGDAFFLFSRDDGYAAQAINAGAAVIISETDLPRTEVPCLRVADVRKAFALASLRAEGEPQKKLRICAVTGTNGKTTVANMLSAILREAGYKCATVGTLGTDIGGTLVETGYTTPPSDVFAKLISRAADEKYDFVVTEYSSHALSQSRLWGIDFEAGIFTNLSHDHLDYHKTVADCAKAKASLFAHCKHSVINYDDRRAYEMAWAARENVWYYSALESAADFRAKNIVKSESGISFDLETGGACRRINSSLYGIYSVYNMLAASAAAAALGVSHRLISAALEKFRTVPGRMEKVSGDADISVIVDFAHTPDAMKNVLGAAREFVHGKVICVFGCGGERDTLKRPQMCKVACEYADRVIVTSDNPRSEDPDEIIMQIMRGATAGRDVTAVTDRADAIREAILGADPGDCVMILGKGHEKTMEMRDGKRHFSDAEQAMNFLKERG